MDSKTFDSKIDGLPTKRLGLGVDPEDNIYSEEWGLGLPYFEGKPVPLKAAKVRSAAFFGPFSGDKYGKDDPNPSFSFFPTAQNSSAAVEFIKLCKDLPTFPPNLSSDHGCFNQLKATVASSVPQLRCTSRCFRHGNGLDANMLRSMPYGDSAEMTFWCFLNQTITVGGGCWWMLCRSTWWM